MKALDLIKDHFTILDLRSAITPDSSGIFAMIFSLNVYDNHKLITIYIAPEQAEHLERQTSIFSWEKDSHTQYEALEAL